MIHVFSFYAQSMRRVSSSILYLPAPIRRKDRCCVITILDWPMPALGKSYGLRLLV